MGISGISFSSAFEQYKLSASYTKHGSGSRYKTDGGVLPNVLEESDYNTNGSLKEDVKVNAAFETSGDKNGGVKDNPFTSADESKQTRGKDGFEKDPPDCQCETCRNRRYQDGSNDSGVSFQIPTKMDPTKAAFKVKSHEMEHVRREQMFAKKEDRIVVSQSVRIKTGICDECGKIYVSGGETITTTKPNLSDYRSVLAGADITEDEAQMIV